MPIANKLVKKLNGEGVQAGAIHGNKSQAARTKVLAEFKQGKVRVLVATDIAARGIDINQLPHVVNFDLPNVPEDYVHRIGRTGRAGASGEAVSLVSHDEFKQLRDIERLIKKTIPREVIDGFEPLNNVPQSKADDRPRKPKKVKKPSTASNDNRGGNNRAKANKCGDTSRNAEAPAKKRSRRRRSKSTANRAAESGKNGNSGSTNRASGGNRGNASGNPRARSKSRGDTVVS